ncbi:MAG: site-specific tyrosine recombinase XerC [Candidatus Korobacteraceae bacterium]
MARIRKRPKPQPAPETPLAALLDEHLRHLAVKGFTESTLHMRRVHIGMFLNWCREHGLAEPFEITRPVLERYQRYLFYYRKKNGEPLSFASQHARLIPLRVWFKWMTRQNYILHNPASELELPRLGYRLPPVLTEYEAELVLQQPNINDPVGIRDRAMLELFYSTGIRRTELIRLKLPEIDHHNGLVTIRQGKGRKDRVVPVGERALAWLDKYLHQVRPELVLDPDDGTIFLTAEGLPFAPNYLSALVRAHVEASEVGKSGACHLFRHTMATLMLEGGADIRYIQQMLGHAKLDSTQIYTHVSVRRLKEIHSATHPGAKLDTGSQAGASGDADKDSEQRKATLPESLAEEGEDENE